MYKSAPYWDGFFNIVCLESEAKDIIAGESAYSYVIDEYLRIHNAEGVEVSIYGADGRCEWRMQDYDGSGIPLEPGIHIVRVGSETIKVAI